MLNIKQNKKQNKASKKRGFTLVELLVTMVIFVVITGVVIVNSNKFDSTVLLNNFAYDVALTIKQAQSYGVNVRESSVGTFSSSYGVYFNVGTGGDRTKFVLFNDTGDSSAYTGMPIGGPDFMYNGSLTSCSVDDPECIQKFSMTKGTYVKSICAGTDEANCDNNSVNQLSILFKRPDLGAKIYYRNSEATSPLGPNSYAKIVLSSASGQTASVVVTSVGQIYVKKN